MSDDESIAKNGLNLTEVTAFGCTSRGQAYRTGRWLIETEKLEKETITFTVGREGLMHLPGDIIRVNDNDYAGANIGGRVLAVNGNKITLDREITLSGNSFLTYINKSAKESTLRITAVNGTIATLASTPSDIEPYTVWALTTEQIKSGLYKAMTLTENDDGTFTVTALQHEPQKEAIVDKSAHFVPTNKTAYRAPQIQDVDTKVGYDGKLYVTADIGSGDGEVTFDVRIVKDGKLYEYRQGLTNPNLALENLPNGEYTVIIYAKNKAGQVTSEKASHFTINKPPAPTGVNVSGGLGAITIEWDWVDDVTYTEIFASEDEHFANASKIAKVLSRSHVHSVGAEQIRYYWLRHVRGVNNGPFYQEQGIKGESAVDLDKKLEELNKELSKNIIDEVIDTALPARKLEMIKTVERLETPTENLGHHQIYNEADGKLYVWDGNKYTAKVQAVDLEGQLASSQLDQTLIEQLNRADSTASSAALEAGNVKNSLAQEITNRQKAIQAEVTNRNNAIKAESANLTKKIQDEASARGTAINQLQNVDAQQAQQIATITAKANNALSGITAEQKARADGDKANADKITALTSRVGSAESGIATLQTSVATANRSVSELSQNLNAKIDGISVGGRNLLIGSNAFIDGQSEFYLKNTQETKYFSISPSVDYSLIRQLTLSAYIEIENFKRVEIAGATTRIGFEIKLTYTDNTVQYVGVWKTNSNTTQGINFTGRLSNKFNVPAGKTIKQIDSRFIQLRAASFDRALVKLPKLEIGNIATDWSPAPEDIESSVNAVSADLTSYKQTQANIDKAQTDQITAHTARLGTAESKISAAEQTLTTLNSSMATKFSEVTANFTKVNNNLTTLNGNLTTVKNDIAARITAEERARADGDKANADKITALTARVGTAESGIATLQTSVATANRSVSELSQNLNAKIDGISVGGRNLLKNSQAERSVSNDSTKEKFIPHYVLHQPLASSTDYVLSFEYKTTVNSKLNQVGFVSTVRQHKFKTDIPVSEQWIKNQFKFTTGNNPDQRGYIRFDNEGTKNGQIATFWVRNVKLERGTTATDWSPAPEDIENSVNAVSADLTTYKATQANIDKAQTDQITAHTARLGTAESKISAAERSISTLNSSMATKFSEVTANFTKVNNNLTTLNGNLTAAKTELASRITAEERARADGDKANADKITALTSRVGSAEASLTSTSRTVATLDGKVQALHTIQAVAISGGKKAIAGISMGATGSESSVIVMADKFNVVKNAQDGTVKPMFGVVNNKVAVNGDLIADGAISARMMAANSVQAGAIQAGAIRTNHIATGEITADRLAIGLGGNLLYNPIFANPTNGVPHGWFLADEVPAGNRGERQCIQDPYWGLKKGGYLHNENVIRYSNLNSQGLNKRTLLCQDVPVAGGKWYIGSVYVGNHRSTAVSLYFDFISADNQFLYGSQQAVTYNVGFGGLSDAFRLKMSAQAPHNAAKLRFYIVLHDRNPAAGSETSCYMFAARPMLEECTEYTKEPSPWQNSGVTAIHGGSIVTKSITTEQLGANSVTANEIAANSIAAKHIAANTITSTHIVSKGITADKLNVSTLSAVSGNLGTITAGSISGTTITGNTINSGNINGATIKGGSISGTTISGTTINGGSINGATGRFSGTIYAQNIIGDVVKMYSCNNRATITIPAAPFNRTVYILPFILSGFYQSDSGGDNGPIISYATATIKIQSTTVLNVRTYQTESYDAERNIPANQSATLYYTGSLSKIRALVYRS